MHLRCGGSGFGYLFLCPLGHDSLLADRHEWPGWDLRFVALSGHPAKLMDLRIRTIARNGHRTPGDLDAEGFHQEAAQLEQGVRRSAIIGHEPLTARLRGMGSELGILPCCPLREAERGIVKGPLRDGGKLSPHGTEYRRHVLRLAKQVIQLRADLVNGDSGGHLIRR